MIRVYIKPKAITITGHALFDDYGKDIVCSSVSSIVTTSVNACLSLDKYSIKYSIKKGFLKITILKDDDITRKLLTNMINMLKELERDYSKNIKIEGA